MHILYDFQLQQSVKHLSLRGPSQHACGTGKCNFCADSNRAIDSVVFPGKYVIYI